MKHGQNSRRGRSRGGGKRNQPSRNQTFDSNGPEGKVRGTPQQIYDKYQSLARDAVSAGEHITAEGYYQFAEHYYRILNADQQNRQRLEQQQQQQQQEAEDAADSAAEAAGGGTQADDRGSESADTGDGDENRRGRGNGKRRGSGGNRQRDENAKASGDGNGGDSPSEEASGDGNDADKDATKESDADNADSSEPAVSA